MLYNVSFTFCRLYGDTHTHTETHTHTQRPQEKVCILETRTPLVSQRRWAGLFAGLYELLAALSSPKAGYCWVKWHWSGIMTHLEVYSLRFLFHQAFEVVAEFLAAEVGGEHSPDTSCTVRDCSPFLITAYQAYKIDWNGQTENHVEHLSRGSGKGRTEMNSIEWVCTLCNRVVSILYLCQMVLTQSCVGIAVGFLEGGATECWERIKSIRRNSWKLLDLVAWNMVKLLDFQTNQGNLIYPISNIQYHSYYVFCSFGTFNPRSCWCAVTLPPWLRHIFSIWHLHASCVVPFAEQFSQSNAQTWDKSRCPKRGLNLFFRCTW